MINLLIKDQRYSNHFGSEIGLKENRKEIVIWV